MLPSNGSNLWLDGGMQFDECSSVTSGAQAYELSSVSSVASSYMSETEHYMKPVSACVDTMIYQSGSMDRLESIEQYLRNQGESKCPDLYIGLTDHINQESLDILMSECDEFFGNLNQVNSSTDSPESGVSSPDSCYWSNSSSLSFNPLEGNEEFYESDSLQSSCSFSSPASSSSGIDEGNYRKTRKSTKKRARKLRGTKNCPHIWELNRDMLKNPDKYGKLIEWVDQKNLIFKILDQRGVAEEWARRKNRDEPMKFECVGRGMRYSRNASGYFAKLTSEQSKKYGKKLVFAFGSSAAKMCPWLSSIMKPNLFTKSREYLFGNKIIKISVVAHKSNQIEIERMASAGGDDVEMKTESGSDTELKRNITTGGMMDESSASDAKSSKLESQFFTVCLEIPDAKIRVNGSKIEICTEDSSTPDSILSFDYSSHDLKHKVVNNKELKFNLCDNRGYLTCCFKSNRSCENFISQLDNRQPQPDFMWAQVTFGYITMNIEQPNPAKSELKFVFKDKLFTGKLEIECRNDKNIRFNECCIETESLSFRAILDRDEDMPRVKKVLDDFKLNVESSVKISPHGYEQGFSIPYTGHCIYEDVKEYIEKVTNMWHSSVTDFYAPVVKIPQSFGFGKTRLLYEFGKEHLTIFLCLRERVNGPQNDFPLRSSLANYFDMNLGRKQDDANRFFMALIMLALEEIAVLQKAPAQLIEELQEPIYSDPVMRRYINNKILMIREAKQKQNYVSVSLTNDYSSIDQITTSYCQDRPNLDRKETELKVTESLKRLEELLPQMPLPVDIRLDNDLQAIDKNQVSKYANVLSIFQSWTRPDGKTKYILDSSSRVERLEVGMRDINQAAARVKSLVKKLGQPIYFALDESAYLATWQNGEEKPFFRILSEVFRQVFQLLPVVCLSTSTNPSLAEYAFRKEKVTPSLRGAIIDRYYPPPYTPLVFMDDFVNSKYEQELDSIAQHIVEDNICKRSDGQSLYSLILSRKPQDTLFYYGRPLWFSLNRLDQIEVAQRKLISAIEWSRVDDDQKKFAAVAVLASRTTFLIDNLVIPLAFSSELIAKYMATLFHINDEMTVLSYNYPSEPILAEAAARFMSEPKTLKEILREINKLLCQTIIKPIGELDRFVAQLLCLRARDQVGVAKAPFNPIRCSYPITVREYLTALLGEQFVHFFGEVPTKSKPDSRKYYNKKAGSATEKLHQKRREFLDGIICFSHFVKKCDTLKINGVVNDFVGRCAAGLFNNNFPGFDMFIPVLLKNGRFTFILISVEDIVEKSEFMETTLLSHTQVFTDIRIHKDDYCLSLMFDLADESNEVTYSSSSEAFLVSGLGSFPCLDQEMIRALNQLLNASSFNRDNYNLFAQKRAFPGMYEKERQYGDDTDLDGREVDPLL